MVVAIDPELRALTAAVAAETKAMIAAGCTPPPIYDPARCDRCSMIDLCRPRKLEHPPGVPHGWPASSPLTCHLRDVHAMKKLLSTIYVTSDDAWLRKDGANLVVEVAGAECGRAPLHMIDGVVDFGRAGASPAAMAACAESGVTISFLTPNGKFLARVEGPRTGNVRLRRAQFRASEDPAVACGIVRGVIAGKVANQRTVIRRALRDHRVAFGEVTATMLDRLERQLTDVARRTLGPTDVAILRGLEGEAAAGYFAAFDALIRIDDPAFRFGGRSRRPPLDRVNALLSFLYAMLGHDVARRARRMGSTRRSAFFMPTAPAAPASRWT